MKKICKQLCYSKCDVINNSNKLLKLCSTHLLKRIVLFAYNEREINNDFYERPFVSDYHIIISALLVFRKLTDNYEFSTFLASGLWHTVRCRPLDTNITSPCFTLASSWDEMRDCIHYTPEQLTANQHHSIRCRHTFVVFRMRTKRCDMFIIWVSHANRRLHENINPRSQEK